MRGDSSSDWSNTNGVRLLSRDSLRGAGSGCPSGSAMQGSDVYREVLYELQQENSYCNDDDDVDSSLSSERDDETDTDSGAPRLTRRSSKTRRDSNTLDIDNVSSLVQRRSLTKQPGRSILRGMGSSTEDDSGCNDKPRRLSRRVTFKDSNDVIHSPVARRASIAEANPSYRYRAQARLAAVAGRSRADERDTRDSARGNTNSQRTRRHSSPNMSASSVANVTNGDCNYEDDEDDDDDDDVNNDNNSNDDDDNEVKCEVVHSFTPRPRPRRCSYAGISGYENKYKDEDRAAQAASSPSPAPVSTPRVPPTPRSSNRGTQPSKKTSPSNKVTRKNSAAGKGASKKDSAKGRKDTPNSRRHSVV